jgi:hypothetical protein
MIEDSCDTGRAAQIFVGYHPDGQLEADLGQHPAQRLAPRGERKLKDADPQPATDGVGCAISLSLRNVNALRLTRTPTAASAS